MKYIQALLLEFTLSRSTGVLGNASDTFENSTCIDL